MDRPLRTGYVFEELYMWHNPGYLSGKWVEPVEYWENPDTKRRLHNLLNVAGVLDKLIRIQARKATKSEIIRFHTEEYHDSIVESSFHTGGDGGEMAPFAKGGYEIAALSVGGLLVAVEEILKKKIDNAYCLVRPPGHHAERNKGMGFCIFNNIALAALHARSLTEYNIKRVAVIDYDVHHGNGTQQAFWDDSEGLFISLHQDNNYPVGVGSMIETGGDAAKGSNINIPLPPGSGTGAYQYAFTTVVIPAIKRFKPDFIFVSSGFDASYADPLGSMMLTSESFGWMANQLLDCAKSECAGRILFAHEGGYSKDYVPFCGLSVIEAISGVKGIAVDENLEEARNWGYQSCQPHQESVVNAVANIHNLPIPSSSVLSSTTSLSEEELAISKEIQRKTMLKRNPQAILLPSLFGLGYRSIGAYAM
eukprot:gene4337-6139_t